ncbi:transposase, partial [Actinobaculum suis]|uniref:transposase n=1 Tax=Actinobaculum suis TaxID=1657 RepID=UPI000AEEC971
MKKFSKHTPEQIVAKLEKAQALQASGSAVAEGCRELGVSESTYPRWARQSG